MIRAQEIQNRIYELSKEIDKDDDVEPTHTSVIGFQIPDEPDYYEEDEEDDD